MRMKEMLGHIGFRVPKKSGPPLLKDTYQRFYSKVQCREGVPPFTTTVVDALNPIVLVI